MKLLLLALPPLLAACAPAATRPGAAEQTLTATYEAAPERVFEDVLLAVTADPGVPAYRPPFTGSGDLVRREASGPWQVTADRAGGTITATALSPREDGGEGDTHRLAVVLTGSATPLRTRAVFRFTGRAGALVTEIGARLAAKYNRLPATGP